MNKNTLYLSIFILIIRSTIAASADSQIQYVAKVVSKPVEIPAPAYDPRLDLTSLPKDQQKPDPRIDTTPYGKANQLFQIQSALLKDPCNKCDSIKYLAFRQGTNYVTAGPFSLTMNPAGSSGPAPNQLFEGIQNIDGTWSFRANNLLYIRAHNNLSTIDYQFYIGAWERFYVERHGNHVHIQSAQFYHTWWITSGGLLAQLNGGAGAFIIEWYPKLQWLWN